MRKIPQFIKNTVAILVLFYAWSYAIEVDSMYYHNQSRHSNAQSPDYISEHGLCFACDAELTPDGDMYEPDLICPNHECEQSPYYVEDSNE